MQKVMYGVIACLFLALGFLFWRYIAAIKNLENEKYKNAMLESSLKTQNEAIENLRSQSLLLMSQIMIHYILKL